MSQPSISLTPEWFSRGMTFEQYLEFIASPENLSREGTQRTARRDWSGYLREQYERLQLGDGQVAALKWITGQPDAPAKVMMIGEEWSSDCRRDYPVVARLAEAAGLELRIFNRDGHTWGAGPVPEPDSPNADLMIPFLRRRGSETFQSIPVVAFFTQDFRLLYHYLEFPTVYRKARIQGHLQISQPRETAEQTRRRFRDEYAAIVSGPMRDVWAGGAISEIISMLYERALIGSVEEL